MTATAQPAETRLTFADMQKPQLTEGHVQMVKSMRARLPARAQKHLGESALVRKAIEVLFDQFDPEMFTALD